MGLGSKALELYKSLFHSTRRGVEELLKAVDSIPSGGLVVARMPTGYGKTVSTFFLAASVKELGPDYGISRVIHVLPMRSLIEASVRKAIDLAKASKLLGLDDVGYQASIYIPDVAKDQLFLKNLVYTTLDSYVLNFAKITPLQSRWASYHAARASIYTSITVFDEAHLFTDVDESKAFTVLAQIIRRLIDAHLPVIVMTATAPDSLIEKVVEAVGAAGKDQCIVVSVEKGFPKLNIDCVVRVAEYEFDEPRITTKLLSVDGEHRYREHVLSIVKQGIWDGKKILIVRNKVSKAIDIYRYLASEIGFERVVLVHGRLSLGDRAKAVKMIIGEGGNGASSYRPEVDVVISTQVIEAGIDIDADILVTDPAPLAQLVQRVGRVNRSGTRGGEVYIANPSSDYLEELVKGVYSTDLTKRSLEALKSLAVDDEVRVLWRLPSSDKNSYLNLLNIVYRDYYTNLRTDLRVYQALETIDNVILVQRDASKRLEEEMCSFVRETIEVPLIVGPTEAVNEFSECIGKGSEVVECIQRAVMARTLSLSHSYICNHWSQLIKLLGEGGNKIATVFLCFCRDGGVYVSVDHDSTAKLGKVDRVCSNIRELGHVVRKRVLEDICRDFYRLLQTTRVGKDRDCTCEFLGLGLSKSAYLTDELGRGIGLLTDVTEVK